MTELTLIQANRVIEGALAKARALELPPVAVAVLDAGAHLKALQREDGVSFLRVRICQAKAWGALGLAEDSRRIAQRYDGEELQRGFVNALNAMSGGALIPLPGGVLIYDTAGRTIGAVGVAGAPSDQDEACAFAGVTAAGLGTTGG